MANKVTEEEIIHMNEVYAVCGSYAKTAEICGRSASTVRKYIKQDYAPAAPQSTEFTVEFPSIEETIQMLLSRENLNCLDDVEEQNMKPLRKKMIV